ncbi:hypothetical protein DMUE_4047, partial [Dictyocoela muelleri]
EQATFNGLKIVFPEAEIRGCFFHFGHAIWRRVQKLGFTKLYHDNNDFKNCVQQCSAVALIPINLFDSAWADILRIWPMNNTDVVNLKNYIYDTYISASLTILFGRNKWNQYEIVRSRTNNAAEGFHNKLNSKINKSNPSFWEVVSVIKKIQIYSGIELRRIMAGGGNSNQEKEFTLTKK